ncbi:hypothetical protein DPMN_022720 [Dreissena polymorpha]|uniref:Uncharacterized protein n=1 Tax=Dreissena polymorpha TaxID=45954 RepID=A0A9D4SCK2_DREPO|nr:hypothetical protein DPMN_022720 [Dreissena polymorpha]
MPATASATAPKMPNHPDVPLANRRRFGLGLSTASATAPNPETYVLHEDLPIMSGTDGHGAAHATDTDPESGSALLEGRRLKTRQPEFLDVQPPQKLHQTRTTITQTMTSP